MAFLIAAAGAYTATRIADQGLADFLGLKTLRHGTDPLSWAKIHLFGATPESDSSNLSQVFSTDKKFTMVSCKDHWGFTFPELTLQRQYLNFLDQKIADWIFSRFTAIQESAITKFLWSGVSKALPILEKGPLFYLFKTSIEHGLPLVQKFFATLKTLHQASPINGVIKAVAVVSASFFSCILTPSIKFRFKKMDQLEDLTALGILRLSNERISPLHIGLLGTLANSWQWAPICSEPTLVLKGICQLTVAGVIVAGATTFMPGFLAAHTTALVAGAILAAI
jgi:hypothetical protein